MLCLAVVTLGIFYFILMTLVLTANNYLTNEIVCANIGQHLCSLYETVVTVMFVVTALFVVFGYHGCEFLCWLRLAWNECMDWDAKLSRKKLRMAFVQWYMSLQKSIFIIFFVWLYHARNEITLGILTNWPFMARLMCLFVGVCWFFDLYLSTVFVVSEKHTRKTQDNTPGQNKYQVLCCCFDDETDEEVGRELSVSPVKSRKSWDYAKMYFLVHMRWGTPGHRPWDAPTDEEINVVEDVMTGEHVYVMPCCVRNWNTTSIEEYLVFFTFFHLALVIYNMIMTAQGLGVDNNQFVQVYSMFPLGFFLGEKLMIIYTGFIPWWSEFLEMKQDKNEAWAWVGLVINVIDFGMVFFSIVDDCLDLTNFNLVGVLVMMLIDEAFDFLALGKKGNRMYNDYVHSLEER